MVAPSVGSPECKKTKGLVAEDAAGGWVLRLAALVSRKRISEIAAHAIHSRSRSKYALPGREAKMLGMEPE